MVQLLSILRIPKIVHMDQLLNFQLHFEGVETVRMVKVVMGILLMCHYNGCFWYFVGDKTVLPAQFPTPTWHQHSYSLEYYHFKEVVLYYSSLYVSAMCAQQDFVSLPVKEAFCQMISI